jgi:hypothetical protein
MATPEDLRPIEPETSAEDRMAAMAELAAKGLAPDAPSLPRPMSASHERPPLPN